MRNTNRFKSPFDKMDAHQQFCVHKCAAHRCPYDRCGTCDDKREAICFIAWLNSTETNRLDRVRFIQGK